MPQDITSPPSAAVLADAAAGPVSERPREYYTDMPCTEGQGCGGEGVVLPFDRGNVALDEMFGFTDVETLPFSDEVLPVIFDGALLTEDGLLDCFARHYPERAGFLLQLLSDVGDLALGYRLEFLDDAAQATPMTAELSRLEATHDQARALYDEVNDQALQRAMAGRGRENTREIMEERMRREQVKTDAAERRDAMQATLRQTGRWRIDDVSKTIHVYTTINSNVDRMFLAEYVPFGHDGINPLPTNKEGADWLYAVMGDWMSRNGYPGAGSEEEFFRSWLTRNAAGVALVGLGAIELFGGVTVAIGSGGLASVGGVALTVLGFDTLTQGSKMLWTPDRHASERGWIGALVHDTAMRFGGNETAQAFDRGWAVTQIAAGLGAPVVIRYATTRAKRVAASGQNIRPISRGQLDEARLGIAEVKGHRFGHGVVGDYTPLPSGRGGLFDISGVGRFRAAPFESDIRVLLRMRNANIARMSRNHQSATGSFPSQRPIRSDADARALVDEATQHLGLRDASRYVDEIVATAGNSSYFTIGPGGQRILAISSSQVNSGGQFEKLVTAAHELNHARAFHILSSRTGLPSQRFVREHFSHPPNSPAYVREEIIVEGRAHVAVRNALERTGAKIDPGELAASQRYIDIHRNALSHYERTGTWPRDFLRYYGL